ncbi:MAG: tyrosine-type recombinase/integrase [bacterium]
MKLSQTIHDFQTFLKADSRSPHTVRSYLHDLRLFRDWLNADPEISSIKPGKLHEFLASDLVIKKPGGLPRSKGSVNKIKTSVKAFFSWLFNSGIISNNPAAGIKIKFYQRPAPDVLTPIEQKRLLKTLASTKGQRASRDRVIYLLLLNTGLRVQELVSLDIADINLPEKRLTVTVKGGQEVTKVLNARARNTLEQYLKYRRKVPTDSPALFISSHKQRISVRQVQRSFEQWLKQAGIEKSLTVHSIRHTFASTLYEKSNNLLVVQQALGHRSINSTLIYTHINPEQLIDSLESI